ncbi:hypothetical protein CNMCM6069_001601 [Aspergillus lentulus]|nr:hypothetical protein CNMCM6069_001601 [Aspergillus lentulus]
MSSIFHDQSLLDAFKRAASNKPACSPDVLKVNVLDWALESNGGYQLIARQVPVPELAQLPVPVLRIIFSPLDLPSSVSAEGFLWLFDHYAAPSAFLAGRLRSVTHSFGALNYMDGYNCAWFHYLCKNITVARDAHGKAWISDPRPGAPQLKHGDWTNADLFWGVNSLKERLQQIPSSSISNSVVRDPYSLFAIILEELSLQMDNTVWDVLDVFRHIELNTLTTARDRESFTGLHNVSKHILFLQESADATLLTLRNLSGHHGRILETVPDPDRHATETAQGMLAHAETQFQSTSLRLKSLEKRMDNIIALISHRPKSFHLVTQDGNRIMQADSNSMVTIAFVTLIFLPMSTVFTIFGSQFFNFDRSLIRISQSFWIFWLVSIALTLLVIFFWRISIKRVPSLEVRDVFSVGRWGR